MALYTEFEINEMMANQIRDLIKVGYSIDPANSFNDDKSCTAFLIKENYSMCLVIRKYNDCIIKSFSFTDKSLSSKDNFDFPIVYYKSHDNIYSDSGEEARDERTKYRSECY